MAATIHIDNEVLQDPARTYDVMDTWRILGRRRWLIAGATLCAMALSSAVAFTLTPLYRASATLIIGEEPAKVVSIQQVYGMENGNETFLQTQARILDSRPIAEAALSRLSTSSTPFSSSESPVDQDQEVNRYLSRLGVALVPGTQLVRIQFDHEDPEVASRAANEHVQAYIDDAMRSRRKATETALGWMTTRLAEMRQDLLDSEMRLQEYREREQIIDTDGIRALPTRKISDLTERLVAARQALSSAQVAYSQVVAPAGATAGELRSVSSLSSDDAVRRAQNAVSDTRRAVAELGRRYGPQHPTMVAAQAELDKALELLDDEHAAAAERVRTRYEQARAEESAIASELDDAMAQYQTIGRKESDLTNLQRAVDTSRELYDLFYNRLRETTAAGDFGGESIRIVEPAVPPVEPVRPRKMLIIGVVSILVLAGSVIAVMLMEAAGRTVKSVSDAEAKLQRPVVAAVPLLKEAQLSAVGKPDPGMAMHQLDWRFNEAIRTVRTRFGVDRFAKPYQVLLVTSSVDSEGKSTIALNLARSYAQMERTLLIDSDLRRPAIGQMLGIGTDGAGLAEVLTETAKLKDAIVPSGFERLDVLAAGRIPADPLQLLASRRLESALAVLQNEYSRIILDSPPLLAVSDATVLSRLADSVVFVVKAGSTTVEEVKSACALLVRTNGPARENPEIGLLLNQLDPKEARRYGDYGYADPYVRARGNPDVKVAG